MQGWWSGYSLSKLLLQVVIITETGGGCGHCHCSSSSRPIQEVNAKEAKEATEVKSTTQLSHYAMCFICFTFHWLQVGDADWWLTSCWLAIGTPRRTSLTTHYLTIVSLATCFIYIWKEWGIFLNPHRSSLNWRIEWEAKKQCLEWRYTFSANCTASEWLVLNTINPITSCVSFTTIVYLAQLTLPTSQLAISLFRYFSEICFSISISVSISHTNCTSLLTSRTEHSRETYMRKERGKEKS